MGQSGSKAKKAAKGSPVKGSPIKEEPVDEADVKADVENKAPNTTETKTFINLWLTVIFHKNIRQNRLFGKQTVLKKILVT